VTVTSTRAYNNDGDPDDVTHNSGSGIVLGSVRHGLIERSVAHDNGSLCHAPECGVGIWTYDSTDVTIEFNLSYHNETGSTTDGDGFDLDQNTSSSVVEYNYSYGNDGAGFLLFSAPATTRHSGNTVRYNISQNDGRKNSLGAISAGGHIYDDAVSNNTVYLSPPANGHPPAVLFVSAGSGVTLRNNIFYVTGDLPLVSAPAFSPTEVDFQQNDYFSASQMFEVQWGAAVYTRLRDWRNATGQEVLNRTSTGLVVDPDLKAPGNGPALRSATRLEDVTAYLLQANSPLRDAGLDVPSEGRDYFGRPVPTGAGPEVGAAELSG
jgi:hypothetical protein